MTVQTLIDYAYPTMMTEASLKKLHNRMLEDDFDAAIEAGIQAATDLKIAINAIKHMKETRYALREQTETV